MIAFADAAFIFPEIYMVRSEPLTADTYESRRRMCNVIKNKA